MKNKDYFLKDFKSVASGLASTFSNIKLEIENIVQSKINHILNSRGYVSREDFHALEDRVNKIETEILFADKKKK